MDRTLKPIAKANRCCNYRRNVLEENIFLLESVNPRSDVTFCVVGSDLGSTLSVTLSVPNE